VLPQVEVMNESLDCLGEQYAVIEAGYEGRPKRFVLAYYEEKSLRDLIAAPSIIAVGFASREQAAANIEGRLPAVAGRAQVLTTTMENRPERHQTRCQLSRALQRGVAGSILIFDSRSSASAPLRACVGVPDLSLAKHLR